MNHDRDVAAALDLATVELAERKDAYGYDAYAWALLANGRPTEADAAMATALASGTRDALFLYHAGEIALALGDRSRARGPARAGTRHPRRAGPAVGRARERIPGVTSMNVGRFGRTGNAGDPAPAVAHRERSRGGARRRARGAAFLVALAAIFVAVSPAAVLAHPLGNFTINHFAAIRVSPDGDHPRRRDRPGRDPGVPGAAAARCRWRRPARPGGARCPSRRVRAAPSPATSCSPSTVALSHRRLDRRRPRARRPAPAGCRRCASSASTRPRLPPPSPGRRRSRSRIARSRANRLARDRRARRRRRRSPGRRTRGGPAARRHLEPPDRLPRPTSSHSRSTCARSLRGGARAGRRSRPGPRPMRSRSTLPRRAPRRSAARRRSPAFPACPAGSRRISRPSSMSPT